MALTISSIVLDNLQVTTGSSINCTATLSAPAPSGGVTLLVDTDTPLITVPASVTVTEGSLVAVFSIAADSTMNSGVGVSVSVRYKNQTCTATLSTISSALKQVTVVPLPVRGGTIATVTVYLTLPAPPEGATITFTQTGDAAGAPLLSSLPPSITLVSGQLVYSFSVPVRRVTSNTGTTLIASYLGVQGIVYIPVLR